MLISGTVVTSPSEFTISHPTGADLFNVGSTPVLQDGSVHAGMDQKFTFNNGVGLTASDEVFVSTTGCGGPQAAAKVFTAGKVPQGQCIGKIGTECGGGGNDLNQAVSHPEISGSNASVVFHFVHTYSLNCVLKIV